MRGRVSQKKLLRRAQAGLAEAARKKNHSGRERKRARRHMPAGPARRRKDTIIVPAARIFIPGRQKFFYSEGQTAALAER